MTLPDQGGFGSPDMIVTEYPCPRCGQVACPTPNVDHAPNVIHRMPVEYILRSEYDRLREALTRLVAAVSDTPASTRQESWMSAEELTHLDPEDWAAILDATSHAAAVLDQATPDETRQS